MRRWEAIRPISEVNHVPANIQMQKTGAGVAFQGDTALPASDLERSADSRRSAPNLFCFIGQAGLIRECINDRKQLLTSVARALGYFKALVILS